MTVDSLTESQTYVYSLDEFTEMIAKIANDMEKLLEIKNQCFNMDFVPNPTTDGIRKIIENYLCIIFPGFITGEKLKKPIIASMLAHWLEQLYSTLEDQILRAYITAGDFENKQTIIFKMKIKKIVIELLQMLPEIKSELNYDIRAAYEGDPAAVTYNEIVLSYPFVKTLAVHKIAHYLYEHLVPVIPRMLSEWAHAETGIDIHPGAVIGKSFFIDHGTGVVIGETACIGNNVKLYQGVTIGALSFEKNADGSIAKGRKRHPTLCDNVIVYANATILGGTTVIGNNAIIGGNTWITKSVADNTIVTITEPDMVYRTRNTKENVQ